MNEYGGVRVVRDMERFRLLFTNSRPEIPAGYSAPLDATPTRVLINRRIREQKQAVDKKE
jgi:hypothetical protein